MLDAQCLDLGHGLEMVFEKRGDCRSCLELFRLRTSKTPQLRRVSV